ncbi:MULTISPECIES: exonuclease SbcCD subunit D [unclassified Arthrobacter]|uniref:exonuclease SbcCD subunit D n=1 Tax=unclassified Arthrobacter TaxID=235627 RepID=UPI0008A49054|nr:MULTISPECIES: exonuclease SbcCD subunit D [unclassified Arthrobacter]OFT24240.1 hypothetical protein HMPREF3175_01785 [Arthrobacter sp. HMSC08H08]OFT43377.1 hypothetical protein HMPREF3160_03065 [Arthrobacter sp. HMSC06H05]
MKFLHTSDWHLGRNFHGESLEAAQRKALGDVVDAAREHAVDAVLIAGDVYDRTVPPERAVTMFEDTLEELVRLGISVVVTSGNHDSARRMSFGSSFMSAAGVHFRTSLEDSIVPIRFTQRSGNGGRVTVSSDAENGVHGAGGEVVQHVDVYGLPYLEPRVVAVQLGVEKLTHHDVVAAAVARIREVAQQRESQAGEVPVRTVIMAHLFAAGSMPTDSEAVLSVGQLDQVSAGLFAWSDYTALGHLHGPQSPLPNVKYSGSPLPYSFSEAHQEKGGWIVEINPGEDVSASWVAWPPAVPLAILRGPIEELLTKEEHAWAEQAYCQITLTDAQRPERPMERLRERFPKTLVLQHENRATSHGAETYRARMKKAENPQQIAEGFLEFVRERSPNEEETKLIEELIEQARVEQAGAQQLGVGQRQVDGRRQVDGQRQVEQSHSGADAQKGRA